MVMRRRTIVSGRARMAQILLGLAATILIGANAMAADLDQDGLDDAWETANGYNTLLYTRIVHVNTVGGNDATGDGLTAATALKTLADCKEKSKGCEPW